MRERAISTISFWDRVVAEEGVAAEDIATSVGVLCFAGFSSQDNESISNLILRVHDY